MTELLEFWKGFDEKNPPYLHKADAEILAKSPHLRSYFDMEVHDHSSYVASERYGSFNDNRFHLSLLPNPYAGSVESAEIILVQLNPGLVFADYWAEYKSAEFRRMKELTLRQELQGAKFPFVYLDPDFCWHPGFGYWERKFRKILTCLSDQRKISYRAALEEIAQRVAILEIVPYHSAHYNPAFESEVLPSVQAMKAFIKNYVTPRALRDECILIVLRQSRLLEIQDNRPNVIVYDRYQAQGAHLTIGEGGAGQAILDRLQRR